MPFRTAPGTYTNTPLGKELSKTQRLQKEAYPIARTTRATPILGDFGPVNYERFTRTGRNTVLIIVLVVIVCLCIYYFYSNNKQREYEYVDSPPEVQSYPVPEINDQYPAAEINYPSLEGGAIHKRKIHRACPCGDEGDFEDIYDMKANGMMI